MTRMEKIFSNVGVAIFLLVLAIVLLVISLTKNSNTEQSVKELQQNINSQANINEKGVDDLEKYKSYTIIDIYPNGLETDSNLIDNYLTVYKNYSKQIKTTGKFEDAYLYVKGEAGKPKQNLTDAGWSSISTLMNDKEYSGHLLRRMSLINPDQKEYTELLYNFKSIPLTQPPYNDDAEPDKIVSWLNFINSNGIYYINSYVSIGKSQSGKQRYGRIIEMKIGYLCKDDPNSCKIELVN